MKRNIQTLTAVVFLLAIQFSFAATTTAQRPQKKGSRIGNTRQEPVEVGEPLPPKPPSSEPPSPEPVPPASANPTADISVVDNLATKPEYYPGKQIRYNIVVSNRGPSTATNVKLTATSINLADLRLKSSAGECDSSTCTIESIAPGSQTTIIATATIIAEGSFSNVVTVDATPFDPNKNDNTSSNTAEAKSPPANVSGTQAGEENRNSRNNNTRGTGTNANSARVPGPSPSPPDIYPWIWLIPILLIGGLTVAGGGGYLVWRLTRPNGKTTPSPNESTVSTQSSNASQPAPNPEFDVHFDRTPRKSAIDRLQMRAPEIRLSTRLEPCRTTFDGPIPITKKEVRNG